MQSAISFGLGYHLYPQFWESKQIFEDWSSFHQSLDEQTQVDSKPAGQPEHASLTQWQLIAANRPEIGALGTPSWWWR